MNCPAFGHECYNCHGTSHFTALCKRPHTNSKPQENQEEGPAGPVVTNNPAGQQAEAGSLAEATLTTPVEASAPVATYHKTITREDHPNTENIAPHHTGIRIGILSYLFPNPRLVKVNSFTDRAPDGHRSFHTTLQLVSKQGCKSLLVKVDLGADVKTIPLSCYKSPFPKHFTQDGSLKKQTLRSTRCIWSPMMAKHIS